MDETPEKRYWDERYARGRPSGGYSYPWKWGVIEEFLPVVDHVVDVGCGDLLFWEGRDCEDYTGIDTSEIIIARNRAKRPRWRFINAPAEERIRDLKKPVVLCISVLYHIMSEERYIKILENLCHYSSRWILIYTWIENPFGNRYMGPLTDGVYQYFRRFEEYLHIFEEKGFSLIAVGRNPDGIGAFYVFEGSPT